MRNTWSLSEVTAPAVEPLDVDEVKAHCRIDHSDEDAYVESLITAARKRAETVLKRQLVTATWRLSLPDFPRRLDPDTGLYGVIRLPRPPLASVTQVQYTDPDGASQTVASFQTNLYAEPGFICPAYGETWPLVRRVPNAVNIRYTAGYGADGNSVPAEIKHAIKFMVAHWYENREPVLVGTIASPLPDSAAALLAGASLGSYVFDAADLIDEAS